MSKLSVRVTFESSPFPQEVSFLIVPRLNEIVELNDQVYSVNRVVHCTDKDVLEINLIELDEDLSPLS